MTVYVHPDLRDNGLNELKSSDRVIACAGAPADYADATTPPATGNKLADAAMVPTDFTLADDGSGGRRISWPDKTGVPIDDSGNGDHAAFVDDGGARLLLVIPAVSPVSLTDGGPTMTIRGKSLAFKAGTVAP